MFVEVSLSYDQHSNVLLYFLAPSHYKSSLDPLLTRVEEEDSLNKVSDTEFSILSSLSTLSLIDKIKAQLIGSMGWLIMWSFLMNVVDHIQIRGAREHNLKDVDLEFPRNRLIVITGLSGSGKSSLAFDTIYAEGQRRYLESLSAYARQFLPQMNKPDVDWIGGLSPAISIEQKTIHRNPRSTVGTVTEIYDYLRLLFARVGHPYCYQCGNPITGQTVQQMVDRILSLEEGTRFSVLAPLVRGRKGEYRKELELLRQDGYVRVRIDGETFELQDDIVLDRKKKHDIDVYIDRLSVREKIKTRLTDSVETALKLAEGMLRVVTKDGEEWLMSEHNACIDCGISYPEMEPRMFSFNAPQGACSMCNGLGHELRVDPKLVIPDTSLSMAKGAVAPWGGTNDSRMGEFLESLCASHEISVDEAWEDLPDEFQEFLLFGLNKETPSHDTFTPPPKKRGRWGRRPRKKRLPAFEGIVNMMQRHYRETESERRKEQLSRYMRHQSCPTCQGTRLRKESLHVLVSGQNIANVVAMSIGQAADFFETLLLPSRDEDIARRILKEIRERIGFLKEVGLDYITMDRTAGTLSGGEAQRIRLASQIGSALTGVLYILDEPSIGLHPRDNDRLIQTLRQLRDLGNTVVVVEHDEETMRAADHLIDMGPGAGIHGGEIVAQGTYQDVLQVSESLTGQYLSGQRSIVIPEERREGNGHFLSIQGAHHNNLKHLNVDIPLGNLVCITGVSGSGKSSLVIDTLYRFAALHLHRARGSVGKVEQIDGLEYLDKVINIDQSPIGRTPRSNPATYVGLFSPIREIYSQLPEAKVRGYKPGRFSFNVKGGRCESCEGAGVNRIEMHFLPDVFVTCEDCKGRRFNRETLEITYRGCHISDVLNMTIEEGLEFFEAYPRIKRRLQTLYDVGLSYVRLGQAATTLSGGEAQRIKLSKELSRRSTGRTLYILDEPTTGLHFEDIRQLLKVLHRLADEGNTVVVIEHQLDVIKTADWIIDIGPEGGERGGQIIAEGTPEDVAANPDSYTGLFLKELLPASTPKNGETKKKATEKKKTSTKKKVTEKKKASTKKKVTEKKKASTKKKATEKKKASTKKKVTEKKKTKAKAKSEPKKKTKTKAKSEPKKKTKAKKTKTKAKKAKLNRGRPTRKYGS